MLTCVVTHNSPHPPKQTQGDNKCKTHEMGYGRFYGVGIREEHRGRQMLLSTFCFSWLDGGSAECVLISLLIGLMTKHCMFACAAAVGSPRPWKHFHALSLLTLSLEKECQPPKQRAVGYDILPADWSPCFQTCRSLSQLRENPRQKLTVFYGEAANRS